MLNLVLSTLVFRREGEGLSRGEPANAPIRNTAALSKANQRPKPAFLRERAITPPHWPRWGDISSGDWAVFRDNLRGLGCPEEAVQAILVAEVQAWAEAEFANQSRDRQYGVNGSRYMAYRRDLRESQRRMELEERAILEQLLGVPWNQLPTYTLSSLRGAWGNGLLHFLPDNRLDAVHAAYLKVEDLHQYYEPRVTRWMSEMESGKVRSALSAALAEFRVLLSPAELEEVELRLWASRAARNGEMKGELEGRRSGIQLREWFRAERARQLQSNPGMDDLLESHFRVEP